MLCQSLLRPRNCQPSETEYSTPPVTSPEYHETSLLGSQLTTENFYFKSLTLQSLGVRFIPTFGSNFGPKPQSRPHPLRLLLLFSSFHSQASRGKCLSLPKPLAACRAEWDSPNLLSAFPIGSINSRLSSLSATYVGNPIRPCSLVPCV